MKDDTIIVYQVGTCYFKTEKEMLDHIEENSLNPILKSMFVQVPMSREKFDNLPEFQGY